MALNPLDRLVRDMADVKRQLAGRSQLGHSSLENTAIPVYDGDGTERLRIGAQDDGTHAIKYVQGPPPPRPTAPVVSVDGPVVRVRWDGILMGGHIPEDFARIDVHFALASEDLESPEAVRANLATSAGNETVLAATQTGTYRVGLVAMSQSRARSEMSDTVTVDVTLVDLEGALDAVVENARGGSNYYTPTPPPGTDHDADRDLWFDTSEGDDGLVSYSPHRWDGAEWVSIADQRTAALQDALGDFEGTVEQRFTDADTAIDGLRDSLTNLEETTLPALRQDLDAAEGRLGEAEGQITDAFGQLEAVPGQISAAQQAAIDAAAQDAGTKANAARQAAQDHADLVAQGAEDDAIAAAEIRAQQLADAAQQAAEQAAQTKADAARDAAIADATGKIATARQEAIDAAQQELNAVEGTLQSAIDAKRDITWSTSSPPAVYDGPVGSTWFKMSGNGSGAQVESQWRWNGNVWVSTILSSAVLAKIDIGAGTFGSLSGLRLEAGSITTDKVLVGAGRNIIPWGQVLAGASTAPHRNEDYYGAGVLELAPADAATGSPPHMVHRRTTSDPGVSRIIMYFLPRPQQFGALRGTDGFAVTGGKWRYSLTAYTAVQNMSVRLSVTAYNAQGSWAAAFSSAPTPVGAQKTKVELAVDLPESAAYIVLYVRSDQPGDLHIVNPELTQMVGGTLVEPGGIQTPHLAADVLEVGNLKAGAGEIAELVSQKIAAAVGRFVEADIGNLTVTEQSRLADVVAEQIAADTAQFMELEVGKLVASEGILDEAVIKQLFAEVVVSQMSFAESFIGGNAILEGSITAESGIIGSLDLGVAIVGKLHGQYIEAGSIGTEHLEFGAATGDILAVDALNFKTAVGLDIRGSSFRAGDAVEITEDFGIRQFGPDGALNVSLPSDGSEAQFRGDLSARTLTATGRMAIQGPGAIASGGVLELESGVVPPISPPQVSQWWASTSMPSLAEGESVSGLVWADGHWWRGVQVTGANSSNNIRARIEKITASGEIVSSFPTAFGARINGITYLNGLLYVLGAVVGGTVNNRYVIAYSLTGAEQYRWEYNAYGTGTYQPGIGVIGQNIAIAQCWATGELSWRIYRPTDGYQVSRIDRDGRVASDIVSINLAAYDLGTPRIVLGVSRQTNASMQVLVYTNSITNPVWVSEESWYAADYAAIRGLAWDGTLFHTLQPNGDLAQYEPNEAGRFLGDNESDWRVAIGWASNDGSQATPAGPPSAPFRFLRRSRHTKTINDVPEGVERARFYYAKTVGDVSRTDLHSVSFIGADARLAWSGSLPGDWATRSNPPAVNSFVADKPGEIRSSIGGFRVDGSGAGQWGPLTFHANGTMSDSSRRIASGQISVAATANLTMITSITFPVGLFTREPILLVTPRTDALSQTPLVGSRNVTAESAQIAFRRGNDGVTNVNWLAIEQEE